MQYKKFFPFAIFLIVAGFLWKGLLLHPNLDQNTSANLIKFGNDKKFRFPEFNLTTIEIEDEFHEIDAKSYKKENGNQNGNQNESKTINRDIFLNKISLVTIWHSACSGCAIENQFLTELQANNLKGGSNLPIPKTTNKNITGENITANKVQFIGINFTDPKDKAVTFLTKYGNPYAINILDKNGSLGLSLGVVGTPETYIVDKNAQIVLKFVGTITLDVWNNQLLPELKSLLDNT